MSSRRAAVLARLVLRQHRHYSSEHKYGVPPPLSYRVEAEDLTEILDEPKATSQESSINAEREIPVKRKRGPGKASLKSIKQYVHEDKTSLPPRHMWMQIFSNEYTYNARDRVSISNDETADILADAFLPASSKDKIVVEAYPGPGALTRALLRLPKSRLAKLIVLEDKADFLEYLKPLETVDPRVTVIQMPGWQWDSYDTLSESGLLNDVAIHPWYQGVHPNLHFVSHLPPTTGGEQLIAQLFRGIPEKHWLFKYGRVPMSVVLSDYVHSRATARPGTTTRCKLSVITDAVAQIKDAIPPFDLQPYDAHFYPTAIRTPHITKKPEPRRIGSPFRAVNITPLEEQVIRQGYLDKWDYCLRRLFVLKASPLKTAISSLAPGARVLLKTLTDPDRHEKDRLNVNLLIRNMKIRDWAALLKAFDEWPFAPEDLMISDAFRPHEEHNR